MSEAASAAGADSPSPRATRALLATCFFLSGAAGLVYEVLWSRHLHALFGTTTESVAAVLAVFMTGLGLGGHLLGKVADRSPSPMRLYGLLEIGVGLFALVTPALLVGARAVFHALAPHVDPVGVSGVTVKLLLASLVLVPPATLMGGTLPALVRATATGGEAARSQVGVLYALNTLGAVVGTLGSGFVLVEVLGLGASMRLTAVVNIGVGALVVARARRVGAARVDARAQVRGQTEDPGPAQPAPHGAGQGLAGWYGWAGLAGAGAVTMIYEVVFTRVLGVVFGVSSYAFTLVLAVFLAGLGLGAVAAQRVARRRTPSPADFGVSQVAMAAVALAAMWAIPSVPRLLLYARQVPDLSFEAVLAIKAALALLALLPLATVAGLSTPLVLAALAARGDAREAGRAVGNGYMVNTAGTLAGSLLSGFVLVERLGTQGALRAATVMAAGLGLLGVLLGARAAGRRGAMLVPALAAVGVMAAAFGAGAWPVRTYLFSDSRVHRISTSRLQLEQRLRLSPGEVLFFAEGREATVGVVTSGERTLVVNGHPDASDRSDMSTQALAAVVPMVVHPAPRDVLVIGFGSGVSADVAARTPGVASVDVVELEQAVLDASPFFHHVNHAVEQATNVHLVRDDGRAVAAHTRKGYDLIISEPSNPWRAGVASLFTADFYRDAKRALRPGGIFAQWMQTYALGEGTMRMILATLLTQFPVVQLWWIDTGNVMVLASAEPVPLRPERLRALVGEGGPFATSSRRFSHIDEAEELYGRFLLDTAGVQQLVAEGTPRGDDGQPGEPAIHTDDLPLLEFEAPRGLFEPDAGNHLRLLLAGITRGARPLLADGSAVPEGARWAGIANLYREAGQPAEARWAIDRALAVDRSPRRLLTAATLAVGASDLPRADALLDEARPRIEADPASPARLRGELLAVTARLRTRQRRVPEALGAFEASGASEGGLDGALGVERLALLSQLRRGDEALAQAERSLAAARPGAEVEALEVEQVYQALVNLARAGALEPDRAAALVDKYQVAGLPRFPRDKALATLAALANRHEAVLEHARAALSRGALDVTLLDLQARALLALGRAEEANAVAAERRALAPEPIPVPSPIP